MLDNQTILRVLNDWNFWETPPPPSVPRAVLKAPFQLPHDLIYVVQGVRRCGKSTLLTQIMEKLNLNPQDCIFVNLEDPRLSSDLNYQLLEKIVLVSKARRPKAKHYYFFLDEIQNVAQWEKWLHLKTERPGNESYVITGSNAALLSGDLSTVLTGRHKTLELYPFDFEEFKLLRPQASFHDYLKLGGFPRILTDEDPYGLLREYFSDIIERDVRRHVAVRSTLALTQLVKAVFESTGSEISQRSLAGMLGVTADTVGSYLVACEASYILMRCPYFTFSERQRTARNRKYYPIDLGLRNAVVTKTGLDLGKSLETVVFLHLRKKSQEVCYWRKKGEVDFVLKDEHGITPIQVSWDGLKQRHHDALKEFYQFASDANPAITITKDNVIEFLKE